jgi:hypothetical protein
MSAAKPKAPGTNRGHAGAAIVRVQDGRGTIGIMIMVMIMVMTTAAAIVGSPARIVVPANGSNAHGQDHCAKDGGVGAAGWNNGSLARHRVVRRHLAFSAITGGQS